MQYVIKRIPSLVGDKKGLPNAVLFIAVLEIRQWIFHQVFQNLKKNVFCYYTSSRENPKAREKLEKQPPTEGVAESKLCEELRSYGATRHDKKFQCMSA